MYIKSIELINFRNYIDQTIDLNKDINIIYGNNAQGKTNIIESIFLSAMGKSFRENKEKNLIRFGENEATVIINYERNGKDNQIKVILNDNKLFFYNDIKQGRVSDIIGKINVVIFTPDDINIFKEGPQRRRKFLDMLISSLKPKYLYLLKDYNNVLDQRNFYLKEIKYNHKSEDLLDVYDEQLSNIGSDIYKYRKDYIEKIQKYISSFHSLITKSGKESIDIKYITTFKDKDSYKENLKRKRKEDLDKGFTTIGVHRDDFIININNKNVAIFGSQGQQRSSILSLKLSELNVIKDEINDEPVLLLDDFMSELDEERRTSFIENIEGNQVILTCTDKIDIKRDGQTFFIENGIVNRGD